VLLYAVLHVVRCVLHIVHGISRSLPNQQLASACLLLHSTILVSHTVRVCIGNSLAAHSSIHSGGIYPRQHSHFNVAHFPARAIQVLRVHSGTGVVVECGTDEAASEDAGALRGSASSSTPIPLGSSLASTAASAVYCRACAAHGRARHCTFGRATPTVRRSYIHISRVSDERVDKLEKKFRVGQVRQLTGGLSESLAHCKQQPMHGVASEHWAGSAPQPFANHRHAERNQCESRRILVV
jgi:hypothetical protein